MAQTSERAERVLLLNKAIDRAAELLGESENLRQEMTWAEDRLEEANLFSGPQPNRKDPVIWAREVVGNPYVREESVPWMRERGTDPSQAETFEQLILSLIPRESGL